MIERGTMGVNAELLASRALVTGAAAGIGRAVTVRLAALGAEVVVTDIDDEGAPRRYGASLNREVQRVSSTPTSPTAARCADWPRVSGCRDVDILINNAAVWSLCTTVETDDETYDRHMSINLRAPFMLVQALVPPLTARGRGAVVNVSSGSTNDVRGHAVRGDAVLFQGAPHRRQSVAAACDEAHVDPPLRTWQPRPAPGWVLLR
ncbi:SDR family NAD(P)-dependent oxidoreductase [Streptomyces flaveus]|uniref:SDR family NAD(P)-dependent oxidoreductase n=1 Tax=Streptomyces flaveus TaxID=66370 RepID=UPI0033170E38